jgi:hypothetical protein
MTITIHACETSDRAAVATLCNAKVLDSQSCWFQATTVDAAYVGNLLSDGQTIVIARSEGVDVGFGFWCGPPELPWLVALAADDAQVYYRLMAEFCSRGMAAGATRGFAEIGTRATTEKARMDALGVIEYSTIGFEPIAPNSPPEERLPTLLRAECNLSLLSQRLGEILDAMS